MRNNFFLLIGLVVVIWSFYTVLQRPAPERYQNKTDDIRLTTDDKSLRIGDKTIQVELADTPEERTRGLSGRERLGEGSGMLFVFDISDLYGFWMKDMRFSIDIVWIDADWKIVGVERNVTRTTYPQIFVPKIPIKYVLELPSGEFEKLGVDIGSQMYLEE